MDDSLYSFAQICQRNVKRNVNIQWYRRNTKELGLDLPTP